MSSATLREIARRAGVSVDTASRVLNGRNKETWASTRERAERIRRIAAQLDYTPNAAARAMVGKGTHLVGALLRNAPDAPLHYLESYEAILGLDAALDAAGYVLCLVRCSEVPTPGREGSRVFRERMLDGMVVFDSMTDAVMADVERLTPRCVFLDANVWRPENCVQRDERHAGRLAAQGLVDAGCRRLVFLELFEFEGAPHAFAERRQGAASVARKAGLPFEQKPVVFLPGRLAEFAPRLAEMLDGGTGILALTAGLAQFVATVAREAGRTPGRDFALACCDENQGIRLAWPGLSRVTFDRFAMGRQAGEAMVKLLTERRGTPSCRLRGEWVPGTTAVLG